MIPQQSSKQVGTIPQYNNGNDASKSAYGSNLNKQMALLNTLLRFNKKRGAGAGRGESTTLRQKPLI